MESAAVSFGGGWSALGRRVESIRLIHTSSKAWARVGDRRQAEVALDQGRNLLESLPYPGNVDHHFVVEPLKFGFYAMDCYRRVGEDRLAGTYADEVIRASTDNDGTERAPMRIAEARVTLGVVAGRQGDLDQALAHGRQALTGPRKSLPSLSMVSRELATLMRSRYRLEPEAAEYLDQLRSIQVGETAA
jgi:hypothetical protein